MRKEGKHIDEVFRERLTDLNVTPPAEVWETVDKRISRRKIFFSPVYRLAAASVLLMMIIGSFWLIFLRKPVDRDLADRPALSDSNRIVSSPAGDVKSEDKAGKTLPVAADQVINGGENRWKSSSRLSAVRTEDQKELISDRISAGGVEEISAPAGSVASKPEPQDEQAMILLPEDQTSFVLLTATALPLETKTALTLKQKTLPAWSMVPLTDQKTNKTHEKTARWTLGGNFGPFYTYRTLSSTDKFYTGYLNSQENGLVAYAGGITVNYSKKKSRLSLQTGVNYARMGQVADEVIAFKSIKTGEFALLEAKGNEFIHVSEGRLAYDENPVFVANQVSPDGMDQSEYLLTRVGSDLYETVGVTLKQDLGFLEIPVILRYNLIDGGIGINIIGGVGSSILISGKSFVVYGNEVVPLGSTSDLRKANLNGIVGVGMSYKIGRELRFHLEPTFKYYLNPINRQSTVRAHPYSLGVYSGLSLSF